MKIKILNEDAVVPQYQSEGAAGMDLHACYEYGSGYLLEPGAIGIIPTGIAISLPQGFEAQVRPRSGLAAKNGVTVLNSPGTIDSDYRGEIKVILINHGKEPFGIKPGDRIAQLVIARVERLKPEIVWELDETERNENGFGSTGV
jgi:dUTP pyrophosphatase